MVGMDGNGWEWMRMDGWEWMIFFKILKVKAFKESLHNVRN
jgi:hypothetical protein